MELRPYQAEAISAIQEQWGSGIDRTLLVLPTGCHAIGEELLMADGSQRAVEKIQVGDQLLGADGTVRNVLFRHEGTADIYRVTPVKGEPFYVTGDHILTLVKTTIKKNPRYPSQCGGNLVDVSIAEYLRWSKTKKHTHKLVRSDLIERFHRSEEKRTVDPYFLGILLGDGGLKYGINVTTPDAEVEEMLQKQAEQYGMTLLQTPAGKATTFKFVGNKEGRRGTKLHQELAALGVLGKGSENKAVPESYKFGSAGTRLLVLAGLLDSDGSMHEKNYDFISKSKQLAEDTAFLSRSVGLAAYVSKCEKGCGSFRGEYYRVCISGETDRIPCRVARKISGKREQTKNVLRTGFTIHRCGTGAYVGFTVDGDNRYLMRDFTVTHNCGKTIVFCKLTEKEVETGKRVLIMAHRGELLDQAADKMLKATGLRCAMEKAEESCLGSWYRVTVGSVQSMQRPKRLSQFPENYFDTIIVDEAHHCLSDGYQVVLNHFKSAKVLGVTATPDRGDMRNLGEFFQSLAYEYSLATAIREGYLSQIKALTIPLKLDLTGVGTQSGDFKAGDLGTALDPFLDQIADEMKEHCADRKTVVFLPLVATSQKFRDILNSKGFRAAEVNGGSEDRTEILSDFDKGKYNVLCNSMLLTEGWDCPSVDCVVVLRPTKVRSLYCQMVGRGTRLAPGKDHLLLLDFLWHSERHELCHPAHLICENAEVAEQMTKNIEEAGCPMDLEAAEKKASEDVVAQREEALAKKLAEMKSRKRKLVDPLQFEMSIQAADLSGYVPSFGYQMGPATDKQRAALEKYGIFPDEIENAGKAELLLDRLSKRRTAGLSTPKQIRFLEGRGFEHVGTWTFDCAKKLIDRIAANNWRIPSGISPQSFDPVKGI